MHVVESNVSDFHNFGKNLHGINKLEVGLADNDTFVTMLQIKYPIKSLSDH